LPQMARRGRMPLASATAAPFARAPERGGRPSTTPPAQRRQSNNYRLRLVPAELGSRPRRSEPAADPALMLRRSTERRLGLTFSFGVIQAKNKNAFLQDLSFQKIPSYGTNFTLVARGYGHSAKSSRASRSASDNMPKNRGLAFHAILPRLSRYRIASPRLSYLRRTSARS